MNQSDAFSVGDGATYSIGSDRYPFTIIKIVSPRRVILQEDDYVRIDNNGFSELQEYEYTSNSAHKEIIVIKRNNGRWYKLGESTRSGCYFLGERRAYQDPCF